MKKKTLALILILALTLSAATVALAADTKTNGEIKFKDGTVIIIPPTDPTNPCCPCFGKPAVGSCECECHQYDDPADPNAFKNFNLGDNLYFGEWNIGTSGTFDSSNTAQTTTDGTHTGMQVINQTQNPAKIGVQITKFLYDTGSKPELVGAELTLNIFEPAQASANITLAGNAQVGNLKLTPEAAAVLALTTPAGSRVKASWSGSLMVVPGTANWVGSAQAVLTWTDISGTP